MSKNNENKLVPKLRFPDFVNDGEWKEKIFSQLFEFGNGKDYKHLSTGNIPVYGTGGKMLSVNEYLYDGESVCIGRKGTIDKPMFLTGKFWTVDTLFYTHSFVNCIPKFIYYVFLNVNWYDYNEAGGVPSLSKTTISKIQVPIPPLIEEQQKIAACLSSLDEVITAESQKLNILQDHKKGLLQNLFPQEGETVPKLRFKEFENSGEWEETTLTQIVDYENGKAHEQDIVDDGDYIVVNSKFISSDGDVKKFTNIAFCPAQKGDILMVLSDVPNGKAIAKCFWVEEDNRYTVNQRICKITPHNLDSKILYYLLNRNPYFLAFDDGVKQTNLRKEDVLNCPLLIPSDPKEQEKIASCLSSIDELINAQNQKLETLKLHKKGLLQGLFPGVNEI
ncbi:MAG TPA: restriction endonuclease subunit S [bacterium]|nr:restriction endonuclease subunit S [bacterium]